MPLHTIENNILVALSRVSFSYEQVPILHEINLAVRKNDFVVITGVNGGGKTTLLRVLLKLLKPSKGKVTYYENGIEKEHLHIGYLPQKNSIDSHFPITVEEVIFSGLYSNKNCNKAEQQERVMSVMKQLQLTTLATRSIGELSGGQLQRTLLGRAIVSQPQLLILDEPFSYIDANFAPHICSLLQQIMSHTAIVMVTHQPALVLPLATQVHNIEMGILSQ